MTRIFDMIATFIGVFFGLLMVGAVGIAAWLACGVLGLVAIGILATAVAFAWSAATRAGEAARRQAALQVQRQATRQVQRKEPRLAVPHLERREPFSRNDDSVITVIEWGVPARQPTSREPRLFRAADDFTVIEWTEDRRR